MKKRRLSRGRRNQRPNSAAAETAAGSLSAAPSPGKGFALSAGALDTKLRVTEGLLAVAQLLAGSLEVPELARRAVRELTILLKADTSIFFSAADDSGFSSAVAGYHVPELLRDSRYQVSMLEMPPYIIEGLTTRMPVASANVATDPRFEHPMIRCMPIQARSILYTPVLSSRAVRGAILSYWWQTSHEFTDDEVRLAAGVASQLALALENADLYAISERRHRAAAALAETSRLLAEVQGVDTVAKRVVESVRALIGGTVAVVYRLEPRSGTFVSIAMSGDPSLGQDLGFVVPAGVGAIALAARNRGPVATDDLLKDARIVLTDELAQQYKDHPYRAALAAPLLLQDRVIGALVLRDRSGRVFTLEEREFAQSLGHHAAVALESARLHEEKVMLAHEEERRRITYDLHDGIAQLVVGAKQRLDTCQDVWATEPTRAARELAMGVEHLGRALLEMRRVLRAMRPTSLDSIGLVGAIGETLREAAREAGWEVDFSENLGERRLAPVMESAIFRIIQEALSNARRHAAASHVRIELRLDGEWLDVVITDDGSGVAVTQESGYGRGLGLLSMRERAAVLGGTCAVLSQPGQGTRIAARVPIRGRTSG